MDQGRGGQVDVLDKGACSCARFDDSVGFAALAGRNGRSARATDRIDVEGMGEERPFLGNPVEVGGLVGRSCVRSDGAQGMIVAE